MLKMMSWNYLENPRGPTLSLWFSDSSVSRLPGWQQFFIKDWSSHPATTCCGQYSWSTTERFNGRWALSSTAQGSYHWGNPTGSGNGYQRDQDHFDFKLIVPIIKNKYWSLHKIWSCEQPSSYPGEFFILLFIFWLTLWMPNLSLWVFF